MSDILIPGMKMPTGEPLRLVLNPNGQLFVDRGVYYDEFEAVELPEHGDLIERNPLVKLFNSRETDEHWGWLDEEDLINAPVIVPANKEGTE